MDRFGPGHEDQQYQESILCGKLGSRSNKLATGHIASSAIPLELAVAAF
jgi:hypothetical protein